MPRHDIKLTEALAGVSYLLSLSVLVFVRRQFGERVWMSLFIACGFSWACLWAYNELRTSFFPLLPVPILGPWFLKAMFIMTLYHCASILFRTGRPTEIHSFSTGRPLPFWRWIGCRDSAFQRFLEPITGMVIAYGISGTDRAVACWMAAAFLAVFIDELLSGTRARTRILDTIDGRIEAQSLHGGVQRRLEPASPSAAASRVVELPKPPRRPVARPATIMDELDPELRQMLESPDNPDTHPSP